MTSTKQDDGPRQSEPPAGPGPRDRVLRHLGRIARTAATTGAALSLLTGTAGCDSGSDTGDSTWADPMPDPLVCDGTSATAGHYSQSVSWSAEWQQSGADLLIHVELSIGGVNMGTLEFAADPVATDATTSNVVRDAHSLDFDLSPSTVPDAGTSQVHLSLQLTCNGEPRELSLVLEVSASPSAGDNVPIDVT